MKRHLYFSFLAVLLVAASVFLVLSAMPERFMLTSDDDVLTISGLARQSQDIRIETLDRFLYLLTPTGTLEEPLTLHIDLSADVSRDFAVAVYWFDEDFRMWKQVSDAIPIGVMAVEIQRFELGLFAIRESVEIQAPEFLIQFENLLKMAPAQTVGYTLTLAVVSEDGSLVEVPNNIRRGGCGGVVGRGNSKERSELTSKAHVYVDDVDTVVEFVFVGLWLVAENGGCVDSSSLFEI